MSPVEAGLRRLLLASVAFTCLGLLLELLLVEHTGSLVQVSPLVLAGLGLLGSGAVAFAPGRGSLLALRGVAVLLVLGGLLGSWEHIEHNYEFEAEIRPSAGFGDLAWEAAFGASPLLAPGSLILVAILALGATWRHPALAKENSSPRV